MPVSKFRPIGQLTEEKIAEFWSKVDKRGPDECWPWMGDCSAHDGYGVFELVRKVPQQRQRRLAHRVAFAISRKREPIENVLHTCDYPPCNNPSHLFEGTLDENNKDRHRKGRTKIPRIKGSQHAMAKLDEIKVVDIRNRYNEGQTIEAIAAMFSVSTATIGRVVGGFAWQHVDGPIKIRNRTGHFIGSEFRLAKLNEEKVKEIRYRKSVGEKVMALASEFGVSHATIEDAIARRTWKHVE